MHCSYCGGILDEGKPFCPNCGAPVNPGDPSYPVHPQLPVYVVEEKMGWFKFLIYFSLFAGAVSYVLNGILLLTGAMYEDPDFIYRYYDGLRTVDIVFGVVALGLIALPLYTRFRLAGYYADGPKLLNAVYIVGAIYSILYTITVLIVTGESLDMGDGISTLITSGIMIAINTNYFEKRSHMFVN